MPLYDYYCPKCEKRFEAYHAMKDDEPEECDECGTPSDRVMAADQRLRRQGYIFPDKATRKFGDAKRTPPKYPRWI